MKCWFANGGQLSAFVRKKKKAARISPTLEFHRLLEGNFVNGAVGSTTPFLAVSKQPLQRTHFILCRGDFSRYWRKYHSRLFWIISMLACNLQAQGGELHLNMWSCISLLTDQFKTQQLVFVGKNRDNYSGGRLCL